MNTKLLVPFVLVSAVACAPKYETATNNVAQSISDGLGCGDMKARLWTELYQIAEQGEGFPTAAQIEQKLIEKMQPTSVRDEETMKQIAREAAGLYAAVVAEASVEGEGVEGKDLIKKLAALELGDESSASRVKTQASVAQLNSSLKGLAKSMDLSCGGGNGSAGAPPSDEADAGGGTPTPGFVATPAPSSEGALLDEWKREKPKAVYGIYKTMATSYQSCEAVSQKPLDVSTPDVRGVGELTSHPPAAGRWRYVADVTTFLKTNPYYQGYRKPASSCFEVTKNPLIYDFGGKPKLSTTPGSDLDLFTSAGYGSTALGIDCSGLVVTAYLTAGLKFKDDVPLRPAFVNEIPARAIQKPDGSNGKYNCLKYASMSTTSSLKPGDLIASSGHVVMVDTVGADPFGIMNLTRAQCTTANVKAERFNFTIVQSAPIKGAIGINRIKASAYFPGNSSMKNGLIAYGVAACKARFGESSTPKPADASVVRHSGTAACVDKSVVALRRSSCLQTCQPGSLLAGNE